MRGVCEAPSSIWYSNTSDTKECISYGLGPLALVYLS